MTDTAKLIAREPTRAMRRAALNYAEGINMVLLSTVWHAMYDAALSEKEGK